MHTTEPLFYGLQALVVDDSETNMLYTKNLLEQLGISVCTCQSDKEALALLNQKYYDLLIIDFYTPNPTSGLQRIQAYSQSSPHSRKTNFLLCRGNLPLESISYRSLQKPFSYEQLYESLQNVVDTEKTNLYSLDYLEELTEGDKGFMQDMIKTLLDTLPKDLIKLKNSVIEKNLENFRRVLHKIKPTAILISSQPLRRTLEQMEEESLYKNLEWHKIAKCYQVLEQQIQIALAFFDTQLTK